VCYCDGQPATTAQLSFPADVAVTSDGGFLIADNDITWCAGILAVSVAASGFLFARRTS
jgi:hypothetical protein